MDNDEVKDIMDSVIDSGFDAFKSAFELLTERERLLALLEESRLQTLQIKARCLIEYFHISLTLFLCQDEEVKTYMASLEEAEHIDWSFFFKSKRLKTMIFKDKDIKKFISVAQKDNYQELCNSKGIHKLEKEDFDQLKEMIPKSELDVFEEKDAWMNLIAYIEQNFEKIEPQRILLKENKRL